MLTLTLTKNTSLNEAILLLDKSGEGVLPVVNSNKKFIGIVTDGDIRKAILDNKFELENVINKKPYTLSINSSKIERLNFLKKIKRRHLPLLNDEGELAEIFTLDSFEFNNYSNWVVIMAGGLGTRLGNLTKDTPKPMLPLANKPILEHIMNSFIHHGFRNFIFCLNYKGELIKDYFGKGDKWGVNIEYIEENKRLGTGGALSLINFDIKEPIIVTNGDVLTSHSFEALMRFHCEHKALATMCVREISNKIPYGLIDFDQNNNIIDLKEKPEQNFYINAGIYVLESKVLKKIPKDTYFDLPTLFKDLIKNKQIVKCYNISSFWIDIGTKANYLSLINSFRKVYE